MRRRADAWPRTQPPTTSRSSIRISISGTSAATIIRGCAIPKPMPFRYGDYSSLKRNYLPPDYLRDAGALNIVKTVHAEALWDPSDPAGETRWLEQVAQEYGYPHACDRRRALRARRHRRGAGGACQEQADARRAQLSRRGRKRRREAKRGEPARWTIRNGGAAMRCWKSTASRSTCRRRGGISTRRPSWRATFPTRRSSSCIPACRSTAARKASPPGARRSRGRRAAERRDQDLRPRPAGPAVDAHRQRPGDPRRDQHLRARSARCSPATIRSTASPARSR